MNDLHHPRLLERVRSTLCLIIDGIKPAKLPQRLPVVFTREEIRIFWARVVFII